MLSPLIDRERELDRLVEAIAQPPQLVVLRGRRRVGKSFLLSHALKGRRAVFFQADEEIERTHLDLLALEVARLMPGAPPLRFDGWNAALEAVELLVAEGPLAFVLDEFQWLKQAQPALDSIIQRHWDRWERERVPITVILSGSALRLMEQLLDHGSPLFGRATYRPLLEPLDYRRAAELAAQRSSAEAKLRRYAVLGGTPQYQAWAGRAPLKEVIAERVLSKGEPLYEEPLHLLREEQEIRDPGTYFSVVRAIAAGGTRMSEIANQSEVAPGNLRKMLHRLGRLGYLEARAPLAASGPEKRRSSYRLRDPFFRFWFRFVFPNRSRLELGRVKPVLALIERDMDTYMGRAFEDCCREWIGRYSPTEGFPLPQELGSWWSRDGRREIDIVGVSKGRYDLLASCKWSRRAPTAALGQLLEQRDALGPKAARAKLLIFARGFDQSLKLRAAEEDVTLIDADRLFE